MPFSSTACGRLTRRDEPITVQSALPPSCARTCDARANTDSSAAAKAQPIESRISALVCSTTSDGIVVAETPSTLPAICCTRVAGRSVLAIHHERRLLRVGQSRNTLGVLDRPSFQPAYKAQ